MPRAAKSDSEDKPKKEKKTPGEKKPITAYQQYMKDQLPIWKSSNPDVPHKDAFSAVAKLWKEADENPNKGKESKPKEPKTKAPPKSKKAKKDEEEVEKDGSDEIAEDE